MLMAPLSSTARSRTLVSVREELERKLLEIPGVVRGPSRYGHGAAYRCGIREIAHFHGEERMDIRLTREVIRLRRAEGGFDRRVRTRGPSADWVELLVTSADDIQIAIHLVEEAVRANA
jgi:hypothetical protein